MNLKLNLASRAKLEHFQKLTTLITFSNRFSGRFPDAYGECDTLSYVRIQDNQLSGAVPEKFWGLEGSTHVELKNNRFERFDSFFHFQCFSAGEAFAREK